MEGLNNSLRLITEYIGRIAPVRINQILDQQLESAMRDTIGRISVILEDTGNSNSSAHSSDGSATELSTTMKYHPAQGTNGRWELTRTSQDLNIIVDVTEMTSRNVMYQCLHCGWRTGAWDLWLAHWRHKHLAMPPNDVMDVRFARAGYFEFVCDNLERLCAEDIASISEILGPALIDAISQIQALDDAQVPEL